MEREESSREHTTSVNIQLNATSTPKNDGGRQPRSQALSPSANGALAGSDHVPLREGQPIGSVRCCVES